jgi:3-phenylpropionate/cinnamic acid dioxygenase small subunit
VIEEQNAQSARVSAAFMVWRFRGPRSDYYVGRYDYVLAIAPGGLSIRSKRATLDLITLDEAASVSVIL